MSENLTEALVILAVGMITVFIILALVVYTGKALILITNKYAPPSKKLKNDQSETVPLNFQHPIEKISKSSINKKKIAAIIGTVESVTNGKGRIENIQKL